MVIPTSLRKIKAQIWCLDPPSGHGVLDWVSRLGAESTNSNSADHAELRGTAWPAERYSIKLPSLASA